jgi:hypothetical protein
VLPTAASIKQLLQAVSASQPVILMIDKNQNNGKQHGHQSIVDHTTAVTGSNVCPAKA